MIPKIIRSFCVFSIICCIQQSIPVHASTKCKPLKTEFGISCVCTAKHCDYLDNPEPISDNVVIVSSVKGTKLFDVDNLRFGECNKNSKSHNQLNLNVDRSVEYQNVTGFGGALTGTNSYLLDLLDQPLQDQVYKSYYHKKGIGFNLLRTPLGGCDYDLDVWAYNVEPQNDVKLSNFTKLDPHDEIKVKQLHRLKTVSKLDDLKIMASAWSAPPWMKSNGNWTGFNVLKQEYYQTWADYHLRFIEIMNANNMPIWSITTGNEPLNGIIFANLHKIMNLGWTPSAQAVWLNDYLGPTIRNSKYKDVLIFGNDEQRNSFPAWFYLMNVTRPGVLDYLDGFAVHWYWDDFFGSDLIDWTAKLYPGKIILNTESGTGSRAWKPIGPELGNWERGEKYARSFIHNLKHSYNGWITWNTILDGDGGPKYNYHYSDAPIIVNVTNRAEIYKQPMFYAIGHFSKFVPEGSVRIDADIFSNFNTSVETIAFKRPDGRIAVILLNDDESPVDVLLNDSIQGEIKINIPAKSWHSIIYN